MDKQTANEFFDQTMNFVINIPIVAEEKAGGAEALRHTPDAALTLKKIALLSAGLRGALLVFKDQLNTAPRSEI